MFSTVNVPVDGLYCKLPSDCRPILAAPSRSLTKVKAQLLLPLSLSLTTTLVARVAKATSIFAVALNEVPPIVLAVASAVAVPARPVVSWLSVPITRSISPVES